MSESERPSRFVTANARLGDDYADIIEAEFLYDDRIDRTEGINSAFRLDVRHCYDETQALEVISCEAQWLFGRKFYAVREPGFERDELFIQDFGLPRPKVVQEVFWRSMVDEEWVPEVLAGDVLAPDFFLERKRPIVAAAAGVVAGILLFGRKV